jgi:hypothetical protein
VLAFTVQGNIALHPGRVNLLVPFGALVLAACLGGLTVLLMGRVVPRARRAVRSRIAERRRLLAAANAELRARAMMDELCPHGWRAQLMLGGTPAEATTGDEPRPHGNWVALDWTAFEDESARVEVVRRVWAPTIHEALDAMVADRRTDETLQHVEQDALADGALWPDL